MHGGWPATADEGMRSQFSASLCAALFESVVLMQLAAATDRKVKARRSARGTQSRRIITTWAVSDAAERQALAAMYSDVVGL